MDDERSQPTQPQVVLKIYPDRHVEVDPPDDSLADPPPPPNTPWLYLREAARALRDCGSASALYEGWRGDDGRAEHEGMAYLRAPERQTEFARTSILFSAFAAEAYVNEFLDQQLGERFADIERDMTINKYVTHVPRCGAGLRFTKGERPGQGLALLFKARNALVHPKKGVEVKPAITVRLAADSIVAVAQAARELTAAAGEVDVHALAISKQAQMFERWATACEAGLPDLHEDRPPDLFVLAINAELGPSLNRQMRERAVDE
jgi:hypothetical protein